MKQTILFITLLFLSASIQAQDKDKSEKIKTLKVAYITEKLDLSKAEAQKFWPIYNAFEDSNSELRSQFNDKRKSANIETITEAQAKVLLTEMTALSNKRYDLFNTYIKDLQSVLPAKKIIQLRKTEDDFKRKMFEEYKKRRHDKRQED